MVKSVMFLSTLYCCNLALPLHYHKGIVQTCFVSCYIKSFEYFYIFFSKYSLVYLVIFFLKIEHCAQQHHVTTGCAHRLDGCTNRLPYQIFQYLYFNYKLSLLFCQPKIKPFIVVEQPLLVYCIIYF